MTTAMFKGVEFPYLKPSSETYPGESVLFSAKFLKNMAEGKLLFGERTEPGVLVEIREGSFVMNPLCKCVHHRTGEVGAHAQYWAVIDTDGDLWLARRTN